MHVNVHTAHAKRLWEALGTHIITIVSWGFKLFQV